MRGAAGPVTLANQWAESSPITQLGPCAPGTGEVWWGLTDTVSPPSPAKKLLQHFNETPINRRHLECVLVFLSGPGVWEPILSVMGLPYMQM